MKTLASHQSHQTFEDIKQIDSNGVEFWYARALAKVLEYSDFRNFTKVIDKAKEACVNSGFEVADTSLKSTRR